MQPATKSRIHDPRPQSRQTCTLEQKTFTRIRQRHTHGLRDKTPYTLPAQTLYKEKAFYNQTYEKVRIKQTKQTLSTLAMQLSAKTQIDKKMIETKWRPHANITLGSLWNSRLAFEQNTLHTQGQASLKSCKDIHHAHYAKLN